MCIAPFVWSPPAGAGVVENSAAFALVDRSAALDAQCQRWVFRNPAPIEVLPVAVNAPHGAARLLTVRDVAAPLGVSTATVYKLCGRADPEHFRASNAIRVAPAVLDRNLATGSC